MGDVWELGPHDLIRERSVATLKNHISIGIASEKVIAAYHDYLLSTTNESVPLPIDATNYVKCDKSSLFDPNGEITHPSSLDLRSCLGNKDLNQLTCCQSAANAQS